MAGRASRFVTRIEPGGKSNDDTIDMVVNGSHLKNRSLVGRVLARDPDGKVASSIVRLAASASMGDTV